MHPRGVVREMGRRLALASLCGRAEEDADFGGGSLFTGGGRGKLGCIESQKKSGGRDASRIYAGRQPKLNTRNICVVREQADVEMLCTVGIIYNFWVYVHMR